MSKPTCQDFGNGCPGDPSRCVPCSELPMTAEERKKLLETPLTFNTYGRRGHANGGGGRIDGVTTNYIDDNRDADATERKR